MGLIISIVEWDIYYISRGALFFVHCVRNLSIYKLLALLSKAFSNDLSFASMVPFTCILNLQSKTFFYVKMALSIARQ